MLSQKTVLTSSLKNMQKSEKCPFQRLIKFVFEIKVASKPFPKKLAMTKFWFKQFLILFLTFPENGFYFVTQKLQKTKNFLFQMLKIFVFYLKDTSKPFSKKLTVTNFEFKLSWSLFLSFAENVFNLITQTFAKKLKNVLFQMPRTFAFELKIASKPFSKKLPMT